MTSWQRRARIGVATFGVACAVVVYLAFGGRRRADVPAVAQPLPPKVTQEITDGLVQQVSGLRKDFELKSAVIRTYDDGSTKLMEVKITARNRDGRDFVVTSREGRAAKDNQDLELTGDVRLQDSDGFELITNSVLFNKVTGLVSTTGAVSFSKGRMSGSGIGMTYEDQTDVLRVTDGSHITVRAEGSLPAIDFTARSAMLDRARDILVLDSNVHVVHGKETTDSDHAKALLSADDDRITFVELRGHARVEGGDGPLRSMRARDMDLDYADDGQLLERAVLTGRAVAVLRGPVGASGREFSGELLDVSLARDGSVTRVFGEGDVQMTLPASAGAPARVIQARTFEAKGAEGTTLTDVRFTDHVVFRETSGDGAARSRLARSGLLTLAMSSSDAVSSAVFSNDVSFEEDDLRAGAPEATYDPGAGTLRLTGKTAKGGPRVADDRVAIEATSIDIALDKRRIEANGRVKSSLRGDRTAPATGSNAPSGQTTNALPGLLAQDQEAQVTAETRLTYDGSNGTALYAGRARLWQGATEIRGDTIDINQRTGDLIARGSAHSTIIFGGDRSEGGADQIRYLDADRTIAYVAAPPRTAAGRNLNREGARVTGPQGDLRGGRIDVFLAPNESRVLRIVTTEGILANVETRIFTGESLTYRAEDESYHVTGTAATPARMEERSEKECREVKGKTLTAFRSTDTMKIDGGTAQRTRAMKSCSVAASK